MGSFFQNPNPVGWFFGSRSKIAVKKRKAEVNQVFLGPDSLRNLPWLENNITSFEVSKPAKTPLSTRLINLLQEFGNLFQGIRLPKITLPSINLPNLQTLVPFLVVGALIVSGYWTFNIWKNQPQIESNSPNPTITQNSTDNSNKPPTESQIESQIVTPKAALAIIDEENPILNADTLAENADGIVPESEENIPDSLSIDTSFVMPKAGVVADVIAKRFYVVSSNESQKWRILKEFEMARGKNDGDKQVEGDRKTPIGEYFIHEIAAGERIGSLYGALVYKLDYPNDTDKKAQKTGSGIWIHGVEFGSPPTFTKGCIALGNQNVVQLIPHLELGSPVKIVENFDPQSLDSLFETSRNESLFKSFLKRFGAKLSRAKEPAGVFTQARQFAERERNQANGLQFVRAGEKLTQMAESLVVEWADAWSDRDADRYGALYYNGFVDQSGRSYNDFIERKRLIFNANDSISVDVSDFRVYHKGDDSIKVTLYQDYVGYKNGSPFRVARRKNLDITKVDGEWKITGEK